MHKLSCKITYYLHKLDFVSYFCTGQYVRSVCIFHNKSMQYSENKDIIIITVIVCPIFYLRLCIHIEIEGLLFIRKQHKVDQLYQFILLDLYYIKASFIIGKRSGNTKCQAHITPP